MSALAELLRRRGVNVTGCDIAPEGASDLGRHGITVAAGHDPSHVDGVRAVVVTSAVPNSTTSLSSIRVTFNEAVNPQTVAANVSLTGPGGSIATTVSPVGTGNTTFDVTFAAQTAVGLYTLRVGPNVLDPTGNAMDQNQDGQNGTGLDVCNATFSVSASSTYSNTTAVTVPDMTTVASSITVPAGVTVKQVMTRRASAVRSPSSRPTLSHSAASSRGANASRRAMIAATVVMAGAFR